MIFEIPPKDAEHLIGVLGQLPTNSGVFPTLVNLVAQYKTQVAAEQNSQEANHGNAE